MAKYNKHLKVDCLISGGGIAGITLAIECIQLGKTVALIDSNEFNAASKTAAGLINPIVPKRVIPGWLADEIYPNILPYYRGLEKRLGKQFYQQLPMVQIHKTAEEQRLWSKQSQKPELQLFLVAGTTPLPSRIPTPYGYCEVFHTGRLDTLTYIQAGKEFIQQHGFYVQDKLDYSEIHYSGGHWNYKEIQCEKIVFCEGIGNQNNPYFSWIPVKGTAGDIVSVGVSGVGEDRIYKQKLWLVPDAKGNFYAGSNFIHQPALSQPESDVQEIVDQLSNWLGEVAFHSSKRAQRPVIADRRPILGQHPAHKGMYIFNGLGTKGCSLVTKFAPEMAQYVWHNSPVYSEVNSDRFLSFYELQ